MAMNVAFPEVAQRQVYAGRQTGQEVFQGVKSGAIDSNELGALKSSASSNLQTAKGYAADGQITGQEQASIAKMQAEMRKDVFVAANNSAAPAPAPAPASSAPPPAEATAASSSTSSASATGSASASTASGSSQSAAATGAPAEGTGAPASGETGSTTGSTSASAGSSTSARGQAGFSVAYPEVAQRQVFAARQMFQEVAQGVQSGTIDQNELASLKAGTQANLQTVKGFASDKTITGEEQKAIAQMQAQTAKNIAQAIYSTPA